MKRLILYLTMAVFFAVGGSSLFAAQNSKYWVFFTDKQLSTLSKKSELLQAAKNNLTPHALKRRAKVRTPGNLLDEHDLPVSANYLQALKNIGHEPLVVSNWLNAASYFLSEAEAAEVGKLSFVKSVKPVGAAMKKPLPDDIDLGEQTFGKVSAHVFDYGSSLVQNDLMKVPEVHDLGITGKGVWIGMLDTGFKYRDHEAFQSLDVIAERDFINNDGITENEAGQDTPGQHDHGTLTLSTIAGFKEGQLIGPAFGARFLLAKTEILDQEIPQEEDNWVAGIEWLESQGVDIVSSSLGYLNFPFENFYSPSDMDGNTAVTTRAADLAVSRGVVVINSAGNERNSPWHIIIAPADGDSVIAVGAVSEQNTLASFSSVGPTADGRIKPDVVAMGVNVYTVLNPSNRNYSSNAYTKTFDGTSFSCPLTAGVAALILSAHPNLTPLQVRDALRETADRAANPDTLLGWGLVNAYEAVLLHGPAFSNSPETTVNNNGKLEITIKVDSKFGINPNQVTVIYAISNDNFNNSLMMSPGSKENQFVATIPEPVDNTVIRFYFSVVDSSGTVAVHPYNAPDSTFAFSESPVPGELPQVFNLAQNFPNPFNPNTVIFYDLPVNSAVSLAIFNILGQKVRTLILQNAMAAGRHQVSWDGRDDFGKTVPAGIYFYALKANQFTDVKKMVLVH